jgi:hypothetical protein
MSAFGTKRTSRSDRSVSAFRGKADIIQEKADIKKCPLMTQSGHRSVSMETEVWSVSAGKRKAVPCRLNRFSSLPSGTAQFHTMRLFCPVLRTQPLRALLLGVSFAQIWLVLAVQLRCRKIFLLFPSIAILRRTYLLYLPKIRTGAYSSYRLHPDRRT